MKILRYLSPAPMLFGLIFALVFSLYCLTLAPGVVGGDAGEHQFAAPLLGIPHATGYPLYILLGHLWTLLLPTSSAAWEMNLFSAFWGAMAAGVTGLVVYRLTASAPAKTVEPGPFLSSVAAGLVLAWGLTLWQWSVIAGVRSLNVFFFALLTLQAIIWQQHQQAGETAASQRMLRWLALTVGLSLAHHRTTIFYLPSLTLWIAAHDRRLPWQPRRWLPLLLLAIAPLTLYLFIYIRGITGPPYSHEQITDFASFWFLVGASDSTGLFLYVAPEFLPARLSFIGADILAQLSWPGLILLLLGLINLLREQPRQLLFQGLLVGLLLIFVIDFEVVNLNEAPTWYLMPAYFLFAVWVGIGLNQLRRGAKLRGAWQAVIPLGFTALLLLTLAYPNWQQLQMEATGPVDDWRQLLRGSQAQRFVAASLPHVEPGSLILSDWEQYTPFVYAQLINGLRPDVTARLPLDNWPQKVAAAHADNQPVYLTRRTNDLPGTPTLSMVGPLIQVRQQPQTELPATATPLAANLEEQLLLQGYQMTVWPQHEPGPMNRVGPILQLQLYWSVPQTVTVDYALSLRLLNAQGQALLKRDATHPVLSSYPTSLWQPGELVGDFYELPLPQQPQPLTLLILPYRHEGAGQWHNLTLNSTDPPQQGVRLPVPAW